MHAAAVTNVANLWIDTNGGSCQRQATPTAYNDVTACGDFNAAYQAAKPGDMIYVRAGTYTGQNIRYNAEFEGSSQQAAYESVRDATIQSEPGADVTISQGNVSTFIGTTAGGVRGATHLKISGTVGHPMNVESDITITGCGANSGQQCQTNSGGNYITLSYLKITDSVALYCGSCDHLIVDHSLLQGRASYSLATCTGANHPEVSNIADANLSGGRKLKRPNHLTFSHDTFQNWARCGALDHTECLQFEPADDVTLDHNIFKMCDTINVTFGPDLAGDSLSPAGTSLPNNLTIENNFFDCARDAVNNGDNNYSLRTHSVSHATVRFNSFGCEPLLPQDGGSNLAASFGNIYAYNLGHAPTNCSYTGVTLTGNVWEGSGSACGGGDNKIVSSINFVNQDATDLHLANASPLSTIHTAASCPPDDIDGEARQPASCNAGADEYPVITQTSPSADINKDGHVNILDASIMITNWRTSNGACDLNNSGTVDDADFVILRQSFGT